MHAIRRLTLVTAAAAALAIPLVTAGSAAADPAPVLSCGSTVPGPCSQTAHYTDDLEYFTPLPDLPADCPSFIGTDVVVASGTGNGVEHINLNKDQEAWFTQTFTGEVTLTAYPLAQATFDNDGNVVSVSGAPDSNVPVYTGKLTDWFGGSFNNKNAVFTGTVDIDAVGDGQPLHVHAVFHQSWQPGADLDGPPTRGFDKIVCS